jgi:SAM-dependent methyltransferase
MPAGFAGTGSSDPAHPLHHDRYVRSNGYDPQWIVENLMGPNPLWLMESLCESLEISPGMKVLDLGCGRAMTSIFLAKEFGASVWATDLWIDASDNAKRICEAGVEDKVFPVHAEAHALPFEAGFFDLIVSVDAYQYFGTDDLYLGYITNYLVDGGRIGTVVPAVFSEINGEVPASLAPYWDWDFCCFHGPDWWRTHWAKTGKVVVDVADALEEGWRDWLRFSEYALPYLDGWQRTADENQQAMLRIDQGELFGFTRIIGTKV